jgi:2-oxoglutarate ferredoxin oxidoreductase subunit gamma
MLGTLLAITDILSSESIMKVLETRIPSSFLDMNREALDIGMQLGAEYR